MSKFAETNGIRLHYLDYPGDEPTIVLMHGLTANAHSFAGLVEGGLPYRLISVDLRGRGLSDKPERGYSMAEHAADIVGLLDALGLAQVILGGHSFGGLLTTYIAGHYPERVSKCIVLDAGFLHPKVRELIQPSLDRLGQSVPSWDVYRDGIQQAPFWRGYWDHNVEAYYRADVNIREDGTVKARSRPEAIAEAVDKALAEPWAAHLALVNQPAVMLNALGSFGPDGAPPILPLEKAQETVAALPNCIYAQVPGNHMTMLFGKNGAVMAKAIVDFVGN
ncbi:MAG: alpha/beta hydrolase [Chloroflexi bacterium]|nr:alpha/beta hydrolase [Chloroflexota bacterium]